MNLYREIFEKLTKIPCLAIERSFVGEEGNLSDMRCEFKEYADASEIVKEALKKGQTLCRREQNTWNVAEPFFPKERLIILGAGHVALPVAEFGARVGFLVTVVDDRLSFANPGRFPMAEKVICDDFAHAIEMLKIQESDYICIVTRGHRHDADCLRMIGKGKEPAYLGMIGSRHRVGIVKQELLEEGYDPERMSHLKSPIGLNIGGVTPEEIAISIMAEIIQVKRMDHEDMRVKNRSDLDFDVLKRLAEEVDEPKAVITVIESKGSSPRGAGAKMIAYPDGRILGSIGGGCGEASVLGKARALIGSGSYKVIHVDLTGETAEDEGMVCGGIMDVVVEDFPLKPVAGHQDREQ